MYSLLGVGGLAYAYMIKNRYAGNAMEGIYGEPVSTIGTKVCTADNIVDTLFDRIQELNFI
ncbi:hypothetical protein Mcate_02729 [Meiothermus taiwanensis]|uniref:Uncharacterized protein n=1 Tax=Meiothermus taiwanensis TaxID=172827 RepID=A0A399DTE9_9DEIN|nr:hypothetical protein Mcate_02729 [Meiothermus taiwanensis]